MKEMDYGKDYKYAHNYQDNFVLQQFLPDEMDGRLFIPRKKIRAKKK